MYSAGAKRNKEYFSINVYRVVYRIYFKKKKSPGQSVDGMLHFV